MSKDLIKQRFARKLSEYNKNAKIQKQMAEKLITKISAEHQFNSVLEIGCGTGLLTKLAHNKLQYKEYIALDIVPECENYIKQIDENIQFISSDMEEYIDNCANFDLIISNASLQWVENLPDFIEKLILKLNDNGQIIFSTFGKENFREIYHVVGKTLQYYTKNELSERFNPYLYSIEEEIRIISFKTPKEVLKHIQNTGVNAIGTEHWTKKDLINFEKEYCNFCTNSPTLTYNPLYVIIKK